MSNILKSGNRYRAAKAFLVLTTAMLGACATPAVKYDSTNMASYTDKLLRPMAQPLESPETPLTLDDVKKRALTHNSEYARQARQMLTSLQKAGKRGGEFLPQAYVGAFGVKRSNTNASIGIKVDETSGAMPEDFYTAQDTSYATANLNLTWDLLDLGLNNYKKNRKLIDAYKDGEQNRFMCNKLMVDVEHAYWRAVAADQAEKKYEWLKGRIDYALELSQSRIDENPDSRTSELMFQRELVDINRWYQSIYRSLIPAKAELAKFMNLPAGTQFSLEDQTLPKGLGVLAAKDLPDLIAAAFRNRPEIRQALYSQDLQKLKNKEDILRHLPAMKMFVGASADSNSFLLNQNFASAGASLTWDLLRLGQIGETTEVGKDKLRDQESETEIMASAIVAQVIIAQEQVKKLDYDLSLAWKAKSIQAQITSALDADVKNDKQPETFLIKEELMREHSTLREQLARAELYSANARLEQSIGQVSICTPETL